MKMNNAFLLTDIAGLQLTPEDREIIQHPAVFGILLFTRNYESPQQLKALTTDIHRVKPQLLIAVDQEGGRVQRFVESFTQLKPMAYWGGLYGQNSEAALAGLEKQTITMVSELQQCGVQLSLAPVLDIDYQMNEVIGERSFHQNPEVITQLARRLINTMHTLKMPCMGKHFPGHGGVTLDSHFYLPTDNRDWSELWEQDMLPYRSLITELDSIMLAHIIYSAIDPLPATFSQKWISEVLRTKLNYQGLIVTDDLSMKAVSALGDYKERTKLALEAGCNVVTICNNREGASQVIDNYKIYKNFVKNERISNYIRFIT